jgi:hypothetical protein
MSGSVWQRGRAALLGALSCVALGCGEETPPPFAVDAGADDVMEAGATPDVARDAVGTDAVRDGAGGADVVGDVADAGPEPMGHARCSTARMLSDGETVEGEDFARAARPHVGCFGFVTGPTLYYRVRVPSLETLTVSLARDPMGPAYVPTLRLLPSCDSSRCVTQSVSARGDTATLTWTNLSDDAAELLLAASPGQTEAAAGRFTLSAAIGRGARNATCARATPVGDGASFPNVTFAEATDALPICPGSVMPTAGAALYYRATVPPGQVLTATALPVATFGNAAVLRVIDACGAPACLADSGRASTSGNTVRWTNTGTTPRDVLVAAQNYPSTSSTASSLSFTLRTPPDAARCDRAAAVTPDAPARMVNTLDGSDTPAMCPDALAGGPVMYHRVMVPAGQMLVATSTRTGGASDPLVRVYATCGGACASSSGRGTTTATVRYPNPGMAPVEAIVAVGSATANAVLTYDLAVTFRPTVPNAACSAAEALTDGATLSAVSTESASDLLPACLTSTVASGPVRYYTVNVPAATALTVTLTPRMIPTGASGTVRVYAMCGAPTCLAASARNTTSGGAVSARYVNGPMAQTVVVAAGVDGATNTGTFDLGATLAPAASNAACAGPRDVGATGGVYPTEDLRDGRDIPPLCAGTPSVMSPALWYGVTLPPGRVLVASARRTESTPVWTPTLRLLSACGATTCVSSSTAGATPDQAALVYTNTGTAPESLRVAVNSSSATLTGAARVELVVRPPHPNGTCAAATAVTVGQLLRLQHLREGGFATPACEAAGTGGFHLYYRVTVPAGQALTVTGTRAAGSGAWTPMVQVLDGCDGPRCLAVSPASTTGVGTARWANMGTAAREVFVAVVPSVPVSAPLADLAFNLESL